MLASEVSVPAVFTSPMPRCQVARETAEQGRHNQNRSEPLPGTEETAVPSARVDARRGRDWPRNRRDSLARCITGGSRAQGVNGIKGLRTAGI